MPDLDIFDGIIWRVAAFAGVIGIWSIVKSINILCTDIKAAIKLLSEGKNVQSVGQSSRNVEQVAAAPRTIGKPQVGELAPEVIAPSLRKPPRPSGGFGRRVSEFDGGKPGNKEEDDTAD